MARTVETESLQKHTLHLYAGDFERLAATYDKKGLGASVVIRRLVRAHLQRIEGQLSPLPQLDIPPE